MGKRELKLSRELSKLDFNRVEDKTLLYTHWCRFAFAEFEKWNHKEHSHLFWELHLCLHGSATVFADGKELLLTEDTYIFIPPKSKHTILSESEDYSEFVWGFGIEDNEEINEILYGYYKKIKVFGLDEKIRGFLLSIIENVEKEGFGYYHIIKNELYHIFINLAKKAGAENRRTYHKATNNEISLIKKYICDNLQTDITVDDVILFSGISKNKIESLLKKEYNKTFSQIKREIKAEVISRLLSETNHSMEEIAELSGFSDRYSMGKFFKKIQGVTPGDYRKGTRK